jgi:uncharacterized protein (TIGR02271 family)
MTQHQSNTTTIDRLIDHNAVDPSGDKIGKITDVYLDVETGQPEWLAVKTGLFGTNVNFVPIDGCEVLDDDDDVRVAYSKDLVKDAPQCDADGHLTPMEERELYAHYGTRGTKQTGQKMTETRETGRSTGRATGTGRTSGDDAMTRSEETLDVRKEQHETGRARLRKWVETEDKHITVPVRKEKARLVTEPITDANRDRAMSGKDIKEDEHEITLREERIDVDKHVEPVERVRLEKDVETEQVTVDEQLRKERIDMDKGGKGKGKPNR